MKRQLCILFTVILALSITACSSTNEHTHYTNGRSATNTVAVPILMYHHIYHDVTNDFIVTPETFAMHMRVLYENGFNTVSLQQLVGFVDYGIPLPPNPVVITFDDGYLSVYTYAFPVLKQYGFVATSFIIGEAVGTDTYKDTGSPTIPKFCYAQALSMAGVISIQSHTYDMHQWPPFEEGRARTNVLIWYDECEIEYEAALRADHMRIKNDIYYHLGETVFAIAFPLGIYDERSQEILLSMGVRVTLTTNHGYNIIVYDEPQSLLSLNRVNIANHVDEYELLSFIRG